MEIFIKENGEMERPTAKVSSSNLNKESYSMVNGKMISSTVMVLKRENLENQNMLANS